MRGKLQSRSAPVKGLILAQAAQPDPLGAEVLENWIPTRRGIRVRGGRRRVGTADSTVRSILSYSSGGAHIGFMSTDTALYQIGVESPDDVPVPIYSDRTSGIYSTHQFGTPGGQYLLACNGTDPVIIFDGVSWEDADLVFDPVGPTSNDLSHVWAYRERLMFVQKGTMSVWFLPVNQKGGTLLDFSLASVFEKGGSLLFGSTISLDSGDGIDDRCVFVSDQGEVAVYQGSDPGDPDKWGLVGRYDVGIPLGPDAVMRAGGDLLILTVSGALSLTDAMRSDRSSLIPKAVTRPVEPLWRLEAERRSRPWSISKWASKSLAIIAAPDLSDGRCLILSLDTGAWSVATNWGATCLELVGDRMFAGIGSGVFALDESGMDDADPFVARVCLSFASKENSSRKVASLMRATYYGARKASLKFGVASDFAVSFPDPPVATPAPADPSTWGAFTWGISVWGKVADAIQRTITTRWSKVRGSGISLAPTVQVLSGGPTPLDVEIVQLDFISESGGVVR